MTITQNVMSISGNELLREVAEGEDSDVSDLVRLARRANSPKLAVATARYFDVSDFKKDHIHILAEVVINEGSPQQNRFTLIALDRKLLKEDFDRHIDRIIESGAESSALLDHHNMIVEDEHEEMLRAASHRY